MIKKFPFRKEGPTKSIATGKFLPNLLWVEISHQIHCNMNISTKFIVRWKFPPNPFWEVQCKFLEIPLWEKSSCQTNCDRKFPPNPLWEESFCQIYCERKVLTKNIVREKFLLNQLWEKSFCHTCCERKVPILRGRFLPNPLWVESSHQIRCYRKVSTKFIVRGKFPPNPLWEVSSS